MKKIFIGIDFSKKTFDVTMIKCIDETETRVYAKFETKKKDFKRFYRWCKSNADGIPQEEWLACGENTGKYGIPLTDYIYSVGIDVWIANAYVVRANSGLVRGKNDKQDSARIAEFAKEKKDKAILYKPLTKTLSSLKELLHMRHSLDNTRKQLRVMVTEHKAIFKEEDPILDRIFNQILDITMEIKTIENEIKKMMDDMARQDAELAQNYIILNSFTGISTINAVAFLVFTNNFEKFDSANKMACYWGVAPFKEESGISVHGSAHVSHFCHHWLKGLLSEAAQCAIIHDDKLNGYYHRLLEKGKNKAVALNNVKSKMIHIIFKMIENKQIYDIDYDVKKRDFKPKSEQNLLKVS